MLCFSDENNCEYDVSEREMFKRVILLELTHRPLLCKFAQELLDEVPSYFWNVPASSSGKYHPNHDLGDGGLARHSLMTYRWLKMLLEANDVDLTEYIPSMVVASLFHDVCKSGLDVPSDGEIKTLHEHPLLSAKFILDKAEQFAKNNKDFIEMTSDDEDSFKQDIAYVVSCIETHMGKWVKSKYSDVILPKPKTSIQYIVHLADYCASRKCTEFDYEYFGHLNGG